MTVTLGPAVESHAAWDPDSACTGRLREWDRTPLWRLTMCDVCRVEVAYRVGFPSNRPVSATTEQEW